MNGDKIKGLNLLLNRRSIRKFKLTPVNESLIRKVANAGLRAPNACNLQNFSIIWVKDPELRMIILRSCEVDDFITGEVTVFVICADTRRIGMVLDQLGYHHCLKNDSGYFRKLMSFMDASLLAQNMTLAAEFLELGSVYVGGAFANTDIIKTLKIPKGVLPIMLLCIGYPDEEPLLKPRWPLDSILHVNEYCNPSKKEIELFVNHMDQELEKQGYYSEYLKQRTGYRYSTHIGRMTAIKPNEKLDKRLEIIRKAEFLPDT